MSTGQRDREPARPNHVRRPADPLQMTEAEKRIAEWEARHDVAARGRRAGPAPVQHYLAHERLVHAEQPHPAGAFATPPPRRPVPPAATSRPPRLRRLLHRLLGRGD